MRFILALSIATLTLATSSSLACEVYGSRFGEQVKSDDAGRLRSLVLGEVYIDAEGMSYEDMKSQAKFIAPLLAEQLSAAQVEVYFYPGRPVPHSADADFEAYFAYTPDPSLLIYRSEVWTGDDMSAVEAKSICRIAR